MASMTSKYDFFNSKKNSSNNRKVINTSFLDENIPLCDEKKLFRQNNNNNNKLGYLCL
jgi:hypothetical protein